MSSPKPPRTSILRDPSRLPLRDAFDVAEADNGLVRATTDDTEFDNALDSFEAEHPETAASRDNYVREYTAAASRPSVEWINPEPPPRVAPPPVAPPPAPPPPAVRDALADEISADDMAISEALDTFYAEADVARGTRAAREPIADRNQRQPGPPTGMQRPPRARRSVSRSMMALTAVCGSIAGIIVIGLLVLSRSQPGTRLFELPSSSSAQEMPAAVNAAQPAPAPAVVASAVPTPSRDLTPTSASAPAPSPLPAALLPSAADRAAMPAAPSVTPPARGQDDSRQTAAGIDSRARAPSVPKSNPATASTAKPTTPAGPSIQTRAATTASGARSSGRDVSPTVPPPSRPAPTTASLPPASREPAVVTAAAVPGPVAASPAASSPVAEATDVTPRPARAAEAGPGVTPGPAGANTSAAAIAPVTPPAPSAPVAATAPPPPAASAASAAANAIAIEESAVQTVLNRYRSAYNGLNAGAAKAVWPSVDVKALSRAFDRLESQEVDFSGCQISVDSTRATAACNGNARFVPKVGNKAARREPRTWTFEMRKTNQQWTIDKVNVQ